RRSSPANQIAFHGKRRGSPGPRNSDGGPGSLAIRILTIEASHFDRFTVKMDWAVPRLKRSWRVQGKLAFTGSRGVGELRYFFAAEEAQIGSSTLFLGSSDPGKSVSQSPRLPVKTVCSRRQWTAGLQAPNRGVGPLRINTEELTRGCRKTIVRRRRIDMRLSILGMALLVAGSAWAEGKAP